MDHEYESGSDLFVREPESECAAAPGRVVQRTLVPMYLHYDKKESTPGGDSPEFPLSRVLLVLYGSTAEREFLVHQMQMQRGGQLAPGRRANS